MKIIVRADGNIGPFDSIDVLEDRLRCYRNGQPEDYTFVVIGDYAISEDPNDAPAPFVPVESLEEAIARINEEFEAEMLTIKSAYPDTEREGWPQQQLEAEAYLANPQAPTPIIDAMIAESGEDKSDMVQNIIQKVSVFSAYYGAALGRKRKKIADKMAELAQ